MGRKSLNPAAIGNRITKFRTSNGLTQRELGELIGCSGSSICHYERGGAGKLDLQLLEKMAEAFQVPLNDILYYQSSDSDVEQKKPEDDYLTCDNGVKYLESEVQYTHQVEYNGSKFTVVSTKRYNPKNGRCIIINGKYKFLRKFYNEDGTEVTNPNDYLALDSALKQLIATNIQDKEKKLKEKMERQ